MALWAHAMERVNRDVMGGSMEDPLIQDIVSNGNNIPFIITNENLEVFRSHRIPDKKKSSGPLTPPDPSSAQFVDHPAQTVGVVDDLVRNQVRPEHFEVLVGDDERDVVAVGDDVLNERVLHRTAHHVAVDPLHGVRPQRHVMLLLLLEPLGHVVGATLITAGSTC